MMITITTTRNLSCIEKALGLTVCCQKLTLPIFKKTGLSYYLCQRTDNILDIEEDDDSSYAYLVKGNNNNKSTLFPVFLPCL